MYIAVHEMSFSNRSAAARRSNARWPVTPARVQRSRARPADARTENAAARPAMRNNKDD